MYAENTMWPASRGEARGGSFRGRGKSGGRGRGGSLLSSGDSLGGGEWMWSTGDGRGGLSVCRRGGRGRGRGSGVGRAARGSGKGQGGSSFNGARRVTKRAGRRRGSGGKLRSDIQTYALLDRLPLVKREHPDSPGWDLKDIHWMLQIVYFKGTSWEKVSAQCRKSAEECSQLWTQMVSEMPLTMSSAIQNVKGMLIRSCEDPQGADCPRKLPSFAKFFASKGVDQPYDKVVDYTLGIVMDKYKLEYSQEKKKYYEDCFKYFCYNPDEYKKLFKAKYFDIMFGGNHCERADFGEMQSAYS